MADYVMIPRADYEALVREIHRAVETCVKTSSQMINLRAPLLIIGRILPPNTAKGIRDALNSTVEGCDEVAQLRVELTAIERRMREFDQELTPVRPSSSADIKAAFETSTEYASGRKKAPPRGPVG